MTPMTAEQRKIADRERPTALCSRRNEGGCAGAICVSHPFGRRVQRRWMWCWMCYEHHQGKLQNEQIGRYYCYLQATDDDLRKFKLYSSMKHEKSWLIGMYDPSGGNWNTAVVK